MTDDAGRRASGALTALAGAAALLITAVAAAAPSPASGAPDIEGVWLTGKRKVAVDIQPCDDGLCGRIVWLAKPRTSSGTLKRDSENPDPALRDRPICGTTIIRGLEPDGPGTWTDGSFYYPKHGRSYNFEIEERGDKLEVRAYLGLRFLGKSETWIRADAEHRGCPEAG